MKYIKLFLEKIIITPKEREINNLSRRLGYNLKKFFGLDKNSSDIYVSGYINRSYYELGNKFEEFGANISIILQPSLEKSHPDEFKVFMEEIDRLKISHFISYQLDEEMAEKLLFSIKNNFKYRLIEIETGSEKYNL